MSEKLRVGTPPLSKPLPKNNIPKTPKTTNSTSTTNVNIKLPIPNRNNVSGHLRTPNSRSITKHIPTATNITAAVKAADKQLITVVPDDNDLPEIRHTITDNIFDQQSFHLNNQHNTSNYLNKTTSFASITANEKNPTREQALVFNSIDGVRQIDYILAIGKIISPKHIIYTSRISNNRFCVFLSSKQILETLL